MPELSEALGRFRAIAAAEEPDLFEAALWISALVDPAEDLGKAREGVALLAARVRDAAAGGESPASALRRVLFEEEGWRGDPEDYDAPSNSSVARVLARGRGMPITLSILALEVARLAGVRLTGVGLPGHFVVGGADLPDGTFLDPFDGGELYDAEGLSRRLGSIFGAPVALSREALAPDPPRGILRRVLLNLRRSYERRDRWEEALSALDFAEALDPGLAVHRRERGLVLLKCGRSEEAIAALEEYAESGEAEDADAIARLIEVVRGQTRPDAPEPSADKRIFTLEQARELLPEVQRLTEEAVARYGSLGSELEDERTAVVRDWMTRLMPLGVEIKGLWLVDFDSGAGYYCWKYPEPSLNHFHGYEEGFAGRLALQ